MVRLILLNIRAGKHQTIVIHFAKGTPSSYQYLHVCARAFVPVRWSVHVIVHVKEGGEGGGKGALLAEILSNFTSKLVRQKESKREY